MMNLKDKILFCEGQNFWETKAFPEENIPSMFMCDGPHGLRKQENHSDHLGVNDSRPATCFPTAVSTACSWDKALLGEIGAAIAKEAADQGVGVFLGPGANIKRNPLCGRNFEYFSEDPYLAGKLAASFIKHAQENGIGTSLKHFALNNQEFKRFQSNSVLDERTMREIYLTAFEIAVREGKPKTVMCTYNQINGEYCSDNEKLLTQILREQWGFDGVVMTDWGAMNNRIAGFNAGCDLNMPGGSGYMLNETLQAVENGELDEKVIDTSVNRIMKMVLEAQKATQSKGGCDYETHHRLAARAAEQSAVLLKNEGPILPLNEKQTIAIVGDMAKAMRYQGAGSSHINPTQITHPADVLHANASVESADVAIVFAGLPPEYESEGFDRENMQMPAEHLRMIEETAAKNPHTVVVLFCGAAVEAPWADKVKAILYMGLPGQAGGAAVKTLLYGKANPCGKLAETWPVCYGDCPSSSCYGSRDGQYREGIYVGYRYYDKAKVKPRWRLGFGLSYTQFSYSKPSIQENSVSVTVSNTGALPGAEVVQLYVAPPKNGIHRPERELKGFEKVYLAPGESKQVTFTLDDRSFAVWNDGWQVPGGTYELLVGGDPEQLLLAGTVEKQGEVVNIPAWQPGSWYESPKSTPPQSQWEAMLGHRYTPYSPSKGHFTMNDSVMDMKPYSLAMNAMYWGVKKTLSKGAKPGTSEYRMLMESSAGSPLRSMQISGGMKGSLFEGLLAMANGRYLHGIMTILKGG